MEPRLEPEDAALLERFEGAAGRAIATVRSWQATGVVPEPPDGTWTPTETLRHLIAVEWHVWNPRIESLEAPGEPAWDWTEPGLAEGIGDGSVAAAAVVFAASREATADRVRAMTPGEWRRTGVHATFGRLDVAGLLRVACDHDDEHLASLEALR